MRFLKEQLQIVRYREFVFIQQLNKTWLIRPERSPLVLLPFRTSTCSLIEAKQILDSKLSTDPLVLKRA